MASATSEEVAFLLGEESVTNLKAVIGDGWPKMKPLPEEPAIALCEALWLAGHRPYVREGSQLYFSGPGVTARFSQVLVLGVGNMGYAEGVSRIRHRIPPCNRTCRSRPDLL